jgi:hypothetical protein
VTAAIAPRVSVLALASQLFLIVLVISVPAALAVPPAALIYCGILGWSVGAATGGLLIWGGSRTTTAVFRAFAAGFALKIAGIVAVAFEMKSQDVSVVAPLGYVLAAYFLQSIWTSRQFALSSAAEKTS